MNTPTKSILKLNNDSSRNKEGKLNPFSTSRTPGAYYLNTDISSTIATSSKRKSVLFQKYSNTEENQMLLSIKQDKELTRKVQERRNQLELRQKVKERAKLRSLLVQTKDVKSLELLSKKILRVNARITALMTHTSGETNTLTLKKSLGKATINNDDDDQMDFTSMKDDLSKVDKFLRVNDLIFEGKVMDLQKDLPEKKRSYYYFQRTNQKKLYDPCTEHGMNNKSNNRYTLNIKGFRPIGFRTTNDEHPPTYIPSTFDDIYYQFEARKKEHGQNQESTPEKMFLTERDINYGSGTIETASSVHYCKTEINEPKTPPSTVKKPKTSKKHQRNATASIVQRNSNRLLTSTKVIHESIKSSILEDKKSVRSNNYKKLLLLLAKRLEKPKIEKKKYARKPIEVEDEYAERLRKMPQSAKPTYRKVFKKILAEDRLLCKPNPLHVDPYDQKIKFLKTQKEFRMQSYKTMYLLKENPSPENDDEAVFKDVKIFDNYGNLDSLEWLIKKRNALKADHKCSGAYNPHEKESLKIHYKI